LARRSNKSRTGAPVAPAAPQVQGVLSFTRPTEFVDLPTRGKLYPEGHPFHMVEEAEINYMTAKEEDILASRALILRGEVLDRLLQSVLVDKDVDIGSLYPGDKNALLVAVRSTGYGPEYLSEIKCPSCNTQYEHAVDLTDLPIKEIPEDINLMPGGTFTVELPSTGFTAELKILTSKEQKYLDETKASKAKNNLPESSLTDLLKMIIVSVNSVTNRTEIEKFINSMPALDSHRIRKVYSSVNPSLDMEQEIECPNCKHIVVREVPLGLNFFWPS